MRKGIANSTSSRWNAYTSELTPSWPSKCSKVTLTLTRLMSYFAHPHLAKRTHLRITARTKPSSTKGRFMFCACREIQEQHTGASNHVTLSVNLKKKTVRPSMVRNLSYCTCVISVSFHWHFSPSLL